MSVLLANNDTQPIVEAWKHRKWRCGYEQVGHKLIPCTNPKHRNNPLESI